MFVLVNRKNKKNNISYTLIYPASIVTLDYMNSLMSDQDFVTDIEFVNYEG